LGAGKVATDFAELGWAYNCLEVEDRGTIVKTFGSYDEVWRRE